MAELAARPDVQAAEQDLCGCILHKQRPRRIFTPGLNITANGGFTNLPGSMVKNPVNGSYQLAGSLVAPIFSQRNIARPEATKAQQKQALNNFEYALLSASAEVSDALTVYEKKPREISVPRRQVANSRNRYSTPKTLCSTLPVQTNYLEVLTAQQGLLRHRSARSTPSSPAPAPSISIPNHFAAAAKPP